MKKMNKNTGITLIALVITIIVLLILAGISIITLTGENGVITKTISAKEKSERAELKEELNLAIQAINLDYNANLRTKSLTSYFKTKNDFIKNSGYNETEYPIKEYEIKKVDGMNYLWIEISKKNETGVTYFMSKQLDKADEGAEEETDETIREFLKEIESGEIAEKKPTNNTTYDIIYKLYGGTNPSDAVTKGTKGISSVLPTPEKDGYLFAGWYKDASFSGNRVIQTSKNIKDDEITFHAKWVKEASSGIFSWTFDDSTRTATINGFSESGETEYESGNIVGLVIPAKYNGTEEEYQSYIDYSVTAIGDEAFRDHVKITGELYFPETVKTIGSAAFYGCNGIEKIKIDENITTLGANAFADCSGLKELMAPITMDLRGEGGNGIQYFVDCTAINKITLTKGSSGIGYDYDGSTRSPWRDSQQPDLAIVLEDGIKKIGKNMFDNTYIKSINFPTTLEEIGMKAFYESGVTANNLHFSDSLETIGENAFYKCTNLTGTVDLSENAKNIGMSAFFGCTGITKVIIGENTEYIGEGAFEKCSSITDIVFPVDVNILRNHVFADDTAINKITFTKGKTGVGVNYGDSYIYAGYWPWKSAFSSIDRHIIIEKGVTTIGRGTFPDEYDKITFEYTGTEEEWTENVKILESNNGLVNATITYK